MGALADLQSQAKTFASGSPLDRWIDSEIARLSVDAAVPAAAAATDSVWSLPENTVDHTGGDFTLTITVVQDGGTEEAFTTAAIAYNANAATIEGAIDTAATSASFTSWTNGDISVAGGDLQTADVTVTFDGASVTGKPATVSMADSMTGGTSATDPDVQTTRGQESRPALGVLMNYGVIASTPVAEQDAAASESGFAVGSGSESQRMPKSIQKALMREAAAEDSNNSTGISLEAILAPQDRAPSVQPRTTQDGTVRAKDV